jgi:hypothetical protein
MTEEERSLIGCFFDGYGVAIVIAEVLKGQEYYISQDWHQSIPTGFNRVVDKCEELFHQEISKPNRKVEFFINPLITLEKTLSKALNVYPSPVRVSSIDKNEAFTVISSLLVERKISLASQISGLEKELRSFDPSATSPNHRVYALFNSIGQVEFDRITSSRPNYSVFGQIKSTIRSRYSFLDDDELE